MAVCLQMTDVRLPEVVVTLDVAVEDTRVPGPTDFLRVLIVDAAYDLLWITLRTDSGEGTGLPMEVLDGITGFTAEGLGRGGDVYFLVVVFVFVVDRARSLGNFDSVGMRLTDDDNDDDGR